jgi:DNA modification methylase
VTEPEPLREAVRAVLVDAFTPMHFKDESEAVRANAESKAALVLPRILALLASHAKPAPSAEDPANASGADAPSQLANYLKGTGTAPLFLCGNASAVLRSFPPEVFDFCMTSPPYWGKREYGSGGIGLESTPEQFIAALLEVFSEVRRVLKVTGSFWLNIGDSYRKKCLQNIPWRLASAMTDEQGWVLRNTVIWHKVKGGPDSTIDKLRNVWEPVFHFVKVPGGYYYNVDAIRSSPGKAHVVNGAVVSATGVSGVRYRRQLELSTSLTESEKAAASAALADMLDQVRAGLLSDFRMIIRGQQRTTHSDSEAVSGRAKELRQRGFYFLKYHPLGSKPADVWDIMPEDTQKRENHFAPYPSDLCRIPMVATCPPGGLVLDPFCGTGTTNLVAHQNQRQSVGIDVAEEYLGFGADRCRVLL